MASIKRKTSPIKLYHVTKKGVNNQIIFLDDSDRNSFLKCLSSLVSVKCKIHCYCLMSNHFHILLQTDSIEVLSKSMTTLSCKYVKIFNKRHNRSGSPFSGKFWSEPIDSWSYFKSCLKYILRNPLEAGISDIANYKWSSNKYYYSGNKNFVEKRLVHRFYPNRDALDTHINNDSDLYINMRSEGYSLYNIREKNIASDGRKKIQNYLKRKYNIYNPIYLSAEKKCELITEIHRAMPHIPQKRFIECFQINKGTIISYYRRRSNSNSNRYW